MLSAVIPLMRPGYAIVDELITDRLPGLTAVIGSLDLLYFWMYQPRARTALKYLTQTLSEEEKRILADCQAILKREREISQMFIDGVMGMDFSKGLSFYLQCWPGYLKITDRLLKPAEASGKAA